MSMSEHMSWSMSEHIAHCYIVYNVRTLEYQLHTIQIQTTSPAEVYQRDHRPASVHREVIEFVICKTCFCKILIL